MGVPGWGMWEDYGLQLPSCLQLTPMGQEKQSFVKLKSLFHSCENFLSTKDNLCVYAYVGLFIFHTSFWENLKERG